ncbi:MAG: metalloregulator ArsR/SmtB family transcription factor [Tenuifilum sp.]|uniref:ArsR/SmtB family transcription factor n=1 Tax=Tenuifilum sp. TaxID=2760880 RepID=UPI003096D6DD
MSQTKEITEDIQKLAEFAKAMSHPVRLYILKKLSKVDACCYSGDIADELGIGRSGLSQHFKELKHAGLINAHVKKPYIKYCINTENWNIAKKLFNDLFNE